MEGNWALVGVETTVIGMAVVFLILVICVICGNRLLCCSILRL